MSDHLDVRELIVWRRRVVLAGFGGCLLIAGGGTPVGSGVPLGRTVVLVAATVAALALIRWWPGLLLAAGALSLAGLAAGTRSLVELTAGLQGVAVVLAFVAVLACVQSLGKRGSPGWAAAIGGTAVAARMIGLHPPGHLGWLFAAAVLTACPLLRGTGASLTRGQLLAGALIALVPLAEPLITHALQKHDVDVSLLMILAVAALGVTVIIALVAVQWSIAAAFIAGAVQVAVAVPLLLVIGADAGPARWAAVVAGAAAGAAVAATRWRIPLAAGLLIAATIALFTLNAVTGGDAVELVGRGGRTPAVLLTALLAAAAAAGIGSLVPALTAGFGGALPVTIGAGATGIATVTLAVAKVTGTPPGTFFTGGNYGIEAEYVSTAAVLALIAAAALGGFELSRLLAVRREERRHAEEIRREERERLARPIHDGVLQVLALMQRHGPSMGETGTKLAALAGEQEVALRSLLTGLDTPQKGPADLRTALHALGTPAVDVVSPAQPVPLPSATVTELTAAVRAALDNVHRHAGAGARAWILLEDETDAVRVTVRDDGTGIAPGRLEKAQAAGRLGVAQSMRGRVADLGGTTTIGSTAGEGTEVEFWIPR